MREYKTRKHQIEAFMREAKLPLKTRAEKARFFKAMRDACMVAAYEERHRILKILEYANGSINVGNMIRQFSVLQVLGFEKGD